MKPSWINEGKPPLLFEHVGGRRPGRNAESLLPLCRGDGRRKLTEMLSQVGVLPLRGFGPLEPSEFARFVRDFSGKPPLDPAALQHVREVMASEMSLFRWQAGDLLVLDNVLVAHGRMPFTGARRILLAMT